MDKCTKKALGYIVLIGAALTAVATGVSEIFDVGKGTKSAIEFTETTKDLPKTLEDISRGEIPNNMYETARETAKNPRAIVTGDVPLQKEIPSIQERNLPSTQERERFGLEKYFLNEKERDSVGLELRPLDSLPRENPLIATREEAKRDFGLNLGENGKMIGRACYSKILIRTSKKRINDTTPEIQTYETCVPVLDLTVIELDSKKGLEEEIIKIKSKHLKKPYFYNGTTLVRINFYDEGISFGKEYRIKTIDTLLDYFERTNLQSIPSPDQGWDIQRELIKERTRLLDKN